MVNSMPYPDPTAPDPMSNPAGAMGSTLYDVWSWWTNYWANAPGSTAYIPPPGSNLLANAVQDLKNVQGDVQKYAPNLSNQWGWLVAQGSLLAANKPAKISSATWWTQFKAFMGSLQGQEPTPPDATPQWTLSSVAPWLVLAGLVVFVLPAVLGERK